MVLVEKTVYAVSPILVLMSFNVGIEKDISAVVASTVAV